MKNSLLVLAAFSLLALLLGCAQGSLPSQCTGVSPEMRSNCIYVNAVLEQNPYFCYSISEAEARADCITSASDPSMKTIVGRMLPSERDRILSTQPAQNGNGAGTQATGGQGQQTGQATDGTGVPFTGESISDRDMRAYAIENGDISACEQIAGSTLRKSCLSQIATMKKQPAICEQLISEENRQLCNMYSQG